MPVGIYGAAGTYTFRRDAIVGTCSATSNIITVTVHAALNGGSATTGTFEADEVITQTTTGAVGKVVEFDSDRSLLYYQQERFSGFGTSATNSGFTAFSGTNLITGQTSGATLTPSSDTETVTLANANTVTLTSGYANPELAFPSGNIIYLENRKPIQRASDQTEDIKVIIEF